MKYALLIQGSPFSTRACHSACYFSQTLLASTGHSLEGVFFYQDSVLIASRLACPPRDEINIREHWQELARTYRVPLYICIAAAIRRGIIDADESRRYELTQHSLADSFQLEGLGTLAQLRINSDRLVTFR